MWSEQIIFVYYSPRGGLLESQSQKLKITRTEARLSIFFALVGGAVARTDFIRRFSLVGCLHADH